MLKKDGGFRNVGTDAVSDRRENFLAYSTLKMH